MLTVSSECTYRYTWFQIPSAVWAAGFCVVGRGSSAQHRAHMAAVAVSTIRTYEKCAVRLNGYEDRQDYGGGAFTSHYEHRRVCGVLSFHGWRQRQTANLPASLDRALKFSPADSATDKPTATNVEDVSTVARVACGEEELV